MGLHKFRMFQVETSFYLMKSIENNRISLCLFQIITLYLLRLPVIGNHNKLR